MRIMKTGGGEGVKERDGKGEEEQVWEKGEGMTIMEA